MKEMVVRSALILGVLLLGSSPGFAQATNEKEKQPKAASPAARPEKAAASELEKTLAAALKNNPDLRVAEAKVREAEAELNRVKVQVMQKVITVHHAVAEQKALVKESQARLERLHKLRQGAANVVSVEEVLSAEVAMEQSKTKLAVAEAERSALMGKAPEMVSGSLGIAARWEENAFRTHLTALSNIAFSPDPPLVAAQDASGTVRLWDAQTGKAIAFLAQRDLANAQPARGAVADRIRQALDKPITLKVQDKTLGEVLKIIQQQFPGINFHPVVPVDASVSFQLDGVPLGAALQALEDSFQGVRGLRLAVREYGILVTFSDNLPSGATLLYDFWKGRTTGATPAGDGSAKNRPPHDVEGVVKTVSEPSGHVQISIGSDAGLQKGHTLEVYRLKPAPTYLGTIEVLAVQPADAVAKPVGRSRGPIQVGDRVGSHLITR